MKFSENVASDKIFAKERFLNESFPEIQICDIRREDFEFGGIRRDEKVIDHDNLPY